MSTPDRSPLRRYVKGESLIRQLSSENLNQSIEVLDSLRHNFLANTHQALTDDGSVNNAVLGLITSAGPNGEADDTTKNRYWIKPQRPDPALSPGDAMAMLREDIPEAATIIRATNIGERSTSHGMATNETAYVAMGNVTYDVFPTITHWYFSRIPPPLWIRISASTLVSGSRWKYTWAEVEKTAAGYDGWTLIDGGRAGPSATFEYAYNTIEVINVAARQIWGSGVNAANLGSGFSLTGVANGDVVRAELVTPQVDGALPEAWFSFENSVDGTCT